MSRLSEYSKFDHLLSDSETSDFDEPQSGQNKPEQQLSHSNKKTTQPSHSPPPISPQRLQSKQESFPKTSTLSSKTTQQENCTDNPRRTISTFTTKSPSIPGRYIFYHNETPIYEWDQSLEEISLYINVPPSVTCASSIFCNISSRRLKIGLRGSNQCFIDEQTFSNVNSSESSWYLSDGILNVVLAKAFKGETWENVLMGRDAIDNVDPMMKEEMRKDMMRERFQEENPGFDFRDAEFNGHCPDPRTFMGGIRYS